MNESLIHQKLTNLRQYLNELEPLTTIKKDEYFSDYIKRHAIEKLIELIVENASEINRHIIESSGQRPPQTYYSTFDVMRKIKVLPSSLATRLASTTGLRNRLVHGYEKVQHDIVHQNLKPLFKNYQRYFILINDYLTNRQK